uniref:ATP synthase subunit a n=2 Tax=cassini group TaxID=254006 RepID=A0A3Q8GDB0_9HEMI|nr:ATP synthase F0 subunit 6 [Magicicada cassinii]YP_009590101.1 ATP synthase F0 subunit 6 [Magicicada tredecassini]AWV83475.1 ATP synthase F0 subunit 6 [Magicicada cassinii]AWV83527.1 ATP synthase F0 subunit 6 [Magicicada tredecassini]QBM08592.1 ATP synthase F0 subunit 6 [Magicicada cassinii]QBM08605.1 ATP synthase F0 subunit 6 [Magicicada cassinii]QBM08618.1 ATP synthase F0 subunit 6 [Magicicada cassinii]
MMTNLFSTFDPSTGLFSLNWLSSLILLLFMPMGFWYIPSRYMISINKMLSTMSFELNLLMSSGSFGSSLLFCSLFIFILFNNFLGLFPYIFTSSSHLVFSLSLALPLWLTFILFGFLNNTNHMFCHLVPMGTPMILMPFMVCIETVSNLIRPGSLAVRLTANMIAGHLLMTLLGNSSIKLEIYMNLIILIQMLLMLFESAVCVIQSYVFTVLSTLYYSEVS